MLHSDARRYVSWCVARSLPMSCWNYVWLEGRFLPAVRRLEEGARNSTNTDLLGEAYYFLGDVYDGLCDAPRTALRSYLRCIHLCPYKVRSIAAIAWVESELGHYDRVFHWMDKAIAMKPKNKILREDYEEYLQWKDDPRPRPDRFGPIYELLARGCAGQALKRLRGKRSSEAGVLRSCAHAIRGDRKAILTELTRIANQKAPVLTTLTQRDWFYLEPVMQNNLEFWRILAECDRRYWREYQRGASEYGWYPVFGSLRDAILQDAGSLQTEGSRLNRSAIAKMRDAYIQYQIARITRDSSIAKRLSSQYPTWVEAKRLATNLRKAACGK